MTNEQIQEFYVENTDDIATVQKLSSRNPVLLVGSRGVGKTFLFRVAQSKLLENFSTKKILPVYITFRKASVIQVKRPIQFQSWMLSRICSNIVKELRKTGFDVRRSYGAKLLLGESKDGFESKIEAIATQFESSWRTPEAEIDETAIPSLDDFMDAVEDISYLQGCHKEKPPEKDGFNYSCYSPRPEGGSLGYSSSSKLSNGPLRPERWSLVYSTFSSTSLSISFLACAEGRAA